MKKLRILDSCRDMMRRETCAALLYRGPPPFVRDFQYFPRFRINRGDTPIIVGDRFADISSTPKNCGSHKSFAMEERRLIFVILSISLATLAANKEAPTRPPSSESSRIPARAPPVPPPRPPPPKPHLHNNTLIHPQVRLS